MKPNIPAELIDIPGYPHLKWTPGCTVGDDWIISVTLWAESDLLGAGCRMRRAMRPVAQISIPDIPSRERHPDRREISSWLASDALRSSHLTATNLPEAIADLGCLVRLACDELGEDVTLSFDICRSSMPERATIHMPDGPVLDLSKSLNVVLGALCRAHKLRGHTWSTAGWKLPEHAPRRVAVSSSPLSGVDAQEVILARLCNEEDAVALNRKYLAKQMTPSDPLQWRIHAPATPKVRSTPIPGIAGEIIDEDGEYSLVVLESERLIPQAEDHLPVIFGRGMMPAIRIGNEVAPRPKAPSLTAKRWRPLSDTYVPKRWLPVSAERAALISNLLNAQHTPDSTIEDLAEALSALAGFPFQFSYYVVNDTGLRNPTSSIDRGWVNLPNLGPWTETIKRNLEILLEGFSFATRFSYFHDGAAQPINHDVVGRSGGRTGHETIAAIVRFDKMVKKLKKRQRDAWSAIKNIFDAGETNQAA